MSPENSVEVTGDTIEDAIAAGLKQLNASAFEVLVEVIDEPSAGIFGMGARPARVRLDRIGRSTASDFVPTSISAPFAEESTPITLPTYLAEPPPAPERSPNERPSRQDRRERDAGQRDTGQRPPQDRPARSDRAAQGGAGEGTGRSDRKRSDARPERRPARDERIEEAPRGIRAEVGDEKLPAFFDIEPDDEMDAASFMSESIEVAEGEYDEEAVVGKVVLNELLERMNLHVPIMVRRSPPDDKADDSPWILDIAAGDVMRLVGRRGEVLASLQYLARLITSRELQKRATFIVDVGGYKMKRARSLHNLALRMADEAVQRKRVVSLEPMPPHERRIIHMALRPREDVSTRSVGDGDGRKITIVPRELDREPRQEQAEDT